MPFISKSEIEQLDGKANMATQILKIQSQRLQLLKDSDYFENFRHMQLHKTVSTFYEDQGKSERIKNFPFPRQYASVTLWITLLFALLLPFGLMDIMKDTEPFGVWLTPLLSGLITWVFFLMEKIGDYSENPFEGTYNDIPITNMTRTIEIDLKEMIDDADIPKPIGDVNGFLM